MPCRIFLTSSLKVASLSVTAASCIRPALPSSPRTSCSRPDSALTSLLTSSRPSESRDSTSCKRSRSPSISRSLRRSRSCCCLLAASLSRSLSCWALLCVCSSSSSCVRVSTAWPSSPSRSCMPPASSCTLPTMASKSRTAPSQRASAAVSAAWWEAAKSVWMPCSLATALHSSAVSACSCSRDDAEGAVDWREVEELPPRLVGDGAEIEGSIISSGSRPVR
mmetsp:Transcript_33335/g.48298  ORF Transcript_33335/g.48298 Transcript_33335/m.48298 type:complete len:222 (+) Transcript_33335:287-952(+)